MTMHEEQWAALSDGQRQAIGMKVARAEGAKRWDDDLYNAILRGDVRITLTDATSRLVDRHGRVIPDGLTSKVVDANWDYHLVQPALDYAARLERAEAMLQCKIGLSASAFQERSEAAIAKVRADRQMRNLPAGVYLPFVIPATVVADYGATLEQQYIAALARSYTSQFPDRTFTNYRAGELAGKVTIAPESRQSVLFEQLARGPVVAVYFPTALQGFGIMADREVMRRLPAPYILAGGIEVATAVTMYPDVLARDWNTPGLDCAALAWWSADYSLYFRASDGHAFFDCRVLDASGRCAGGLVFLG